MPFTHLAARFGAWIAIAAGCLCAIMPSIQTDPPRADPPYWEAFGFEVCALPCFAGMTPGETRFDRAPYLLSDHISSLIRGALVSGSQVNFLAQSGDDSLAGLIQPSMGRVGVIRLTIDLPLYALVARLGTPDCVWVDQDSPATQRLIVIYWSIPGAVIGASVIEDAHMPLLSGGWLFDSRMVGMFVSSDSQDATFCTSNDLMAWRGFAPVWHYADTRQ